MIVPDISIIASIFEKAISLNRVVERMQRVDAKEKDKGPFERSDQKTFRD